jgi:hypothetical protein
MTPDEITTTLRSQFDEAVQFNPPDTWQVETEEWRLLVLLSADQSWLRILMPIAPLPEAKPFLEELLVANFDFTQEVRYALHQTVLWGVFQHGLENLSLEDFWVAVQRLISLHQLGLEPFFDELIESRLRRIIQAAKRQGQSLTATLQSVERFYEEGMMGGLDQTAQAREANLAAWRSQLERLWPEVHPDE